eukprot:3596235-Pleurochrysis_carterae.AAC.1
MHTPWKAPCSHCEHTNVKKAENAKKNVQKHAKSKEVAEASGREQTAAASLHLASAPHLGSHVCRVTNPHLKLHDVLRAARLGNLLHAPQKNTARVSARVTIKKRLVGLATSAVRLLSNAASKRDTRTSRARDE